MCACVHVCVCVCIHMCMCVCVCVSCTDYVSMHEIYAHMYIIHPKKDMSIVLNVHPGVQLYTWVDSKKSFCRSVIEGT